MATQKRNSRKGLSTLLAKTHPSQPVAGEKDPYGVYTGGYVIFIKAIRHFYLHSLNIHITFSVLKNQLIEWLLLMF